MRNYLGIARWIASALIAVGGVTYALVQTFAGEETWASFDRPTSVGLTLLWTAGGLAVVWVATSNNLLIQFGGTLVAVVTIGLWLDRHWGAIGITWTVSATPIITFAGLLVAQVRGEPSDTRITTSRMRNAIAGSFILTYLVSVGLVLFYHDTAAETRGVTKTLVTNFTVLMGVIIAFYFGTATREKVVEMRAVTDAKGNVEDVQRAADR